MIMKVGHILEKDENQFHKRLADLITQYQNQYLDVEVQYQQGPAGFSALLLGKRKS